MSFITGFSDSGTQYVQISIRGVSRPVWSVPHCRDSCSQPLWPGCSHHPILTSPSVRKNTGWLLGWMKCHWPDWLLLDEVCRKAAAKGRNQCHTFSGIWAKALYPKPYICLYSTSVQTWGISVPQQKFASCILLGFEKRTSRGSSVIFALRQLQTSPIAVCSWTSLEKLSTWKLAGHFQGIA